MSRSFLPSVVLTGVPQIVNLPSLTSDLQLRVGNESALTLQWQWGGQSGVLYPSEMDVWTPDAAAAPQITLIPISGILPASLALTSNLIMETARPPDAFGGQYPQQMSRLAQTAANVVPLVQNPGDSGIYTVPVNTTLTNIVFPLSPGMQSVRITLNLSSVLTTWTGQTLVGNVTGRTYFISANPGNNGGFDSTFVLFPEDTQLLFSINTTGAANPVKYTMIANYGLEAVNAIISGAGTLSLNPLFFNLATVPPQLTATSSVALASAPGALNTDFTVVSGVGGQRIYVHGVLVNTNSGTNWEVDLWDGPSANNLRIARIMVNDLTSVGMENPVYWDGKGRQLGVGNALVGTLVSGQITSTITGTYGFSQA